MPAARRRRPPPWRRGKRRGGAPFLSPLLVRACTSRCAHRRQAVQRWCLAFPGNHISMAGRGGRWKPSNFFTFTPGRVWLFFPLPRLADAQRDREERCGTEAAHFSGKPYKLSSEYYLPEANWSNEGYQPSFKEHLDVSIPSAGMLMLSVMCLVGMEDGADKEAFEWVFSEPDAINACGQIARFLNDIAAHKRGKNKKDMITSVECYMKEHGVTGEEAVDAISAMVEDAWRTINLVRMEVKPGLMLAAQMVVNLGRIMEAIYLGVRDGYTYGGDLKDLVTAFFLKPVPL